MDIDNELGDISRNKVAAVYIYLKAQHAKILADTLPANHADEWDGYLERRAARAAGIYVAIEALHDLLGYQ